MGAVLVPVLLVLIVLVVGAIAVKRFTRAEIDQSDRLQADERPTLRYRIPAGRIRRWSWPGSAGRDTTPPPTPSQGRPRRS